MKLTKYFVLAAGVGLFSNLATAATDLRQATVKEAVNDVQIIPAGASSGKAAKVSDVLSTPDVMRTGSNSRAELLASDQTVARVGANTVFSFDQVGRKINLQQGTILFHAPTGRGGGVIQTAAATAAVTGTTIMVVSTRNGGFKVLVLEGKARVQLPNGKRLDLLAGQLSFILPGNQNFTNPITFRLGTLVTGSRMVNGFGRELASKSKIQTEINRQEKLLIADTGIEIGDFADDTGIAVIDNSTRQVAVEEDGPTFALAIQSDAFIDSVTLDSDRIFPFEQTSVPTDLFNSIDASNEPIIGGISGAKVFAARNIKFDTHAVDVPLVSAHGFGFYADNDMVVNQSIMFHANNHGLLLFANNNFKAMVGNMSRSGDGDFVIIARNQLDIFGTPGVLNTISAPQFSFISLSARTPILTNFDFNPNNTYSLFSQTGNWYSGPPTTITPGMLHIINGTLSGAALSPGSGSAGNLSSIGLSNAYSLKQ